MSLEAPDHDEHHHPRSPSLPLFGRLRLPIVGLATGSIRDRRLAEVIMNARRKWALENAACALVVFGTIAAVLLVNAESTTGSTDYTRSAPGCQSQ